MNTTIASEAAVAASIDELAQAWLHAHDANDPIALRAVLHDDVTVHSLFRDQPIQGTTAALTHFAATMAAFPDLVLAPIAASVDTAAATYLAEVEFVGHFSGTWRRDGDEIHGTGSPFRVHGALILTIRDNRIGTVRTLFDRDDWLRQITP